jgi:thymidylate synthase (FAD)
MKNQNRAVATLIYSRPMITPPDATIVHPPHGFVRLVEFAGSDLSVVNAARVSYDKESTWETMRVATTEQEGFKTVSRLRKDDVGLLRYLIKNRHGTPLEHNYFQFHVRAPIFVFREWHRHRIGISINEESGRYVELQPDFYLPDDDHCRKQVGKPGHYTYEPVSPVHAKAIRDMLDISYRRSYSIYKQLMDEGVAKEVARAALPVATYSQMLWACNARSLMAFLSLRNAPTAQREIKDYAQVMEDIFLAQMPITAKAFIEFDRVAP